jgi:hypothetical protein
MMTSAPVAAIVVLSVKRTMNGQLPGVRKCWNTDGNSDKVIAGRKGGHL